MKIFITLLLSFSLLGFLGYLSINSKTSSEKLIPSIFKSKIISIKKQYRGTYDFKLLKNNGDIFFAIDRNFNEIENLITIGDSLIVESINGCPVFISNDTLINRCGLEFRLNLGW